MKKDYKKIHRSVINLLKNDGYTIKHIEKPTEEMQLMSVKNNGWAIQYIKDPSEEVKLEAVKGNPWLIGYTANPTEKVKKLVKEELRKIREQY